jgi:integrase/recombinase XerD
MRPLLPPDLSASSTSHVPERGLGSSTMERIFAWKKTQVRHQQAPLLEPREKYLLHMLSQGTSIQRMRSVAAMLLHVIRILNLNCFRRVAIAEVHEGAAKWCADIKFETRNGDAKTVKHFTYIATKWLRYNDMLLHEPMRVEPDDSYTDEFIRFVKIDRGMSSSTFEPHRFRLKAFLRWNRGFNRTVAELTLSDVDGYVTAKFQAGHKPTYVRSICTTLRLFFQLADSRGWNQSKIADSIRRPRVSRVDSAPKGPDWADVRKLLEHDFGNGSAAIRAAAITSLGAIYALRSSEIIDLKVDDFDWTNDIVTIRRSKNNRIQQFPIQVEVGENVVRYLKAVRPQTKQRNLFVTLAPPYRPLDPTTLWVIVSRRLKLLGISSRTYGIHSLRHACATHLLHKGTSLPDIADFLGHTNVRSVSVYAKHDLEALRRICAIDLSGIV